MSRTIHVCVDIEGLLNNTRFPSGYVGMLQTKDGKPMEPHAARQYLYQAIRDGKRVLPTGDCEGFSFQTGCPGHEETEAKTDAR